MRSFQRLEETILSLNTGAVGLPAVVLMLAINRLSVNATHPEDWRLVGWIAVNHGSPHVRELAGELLAYGRGLE